MKIWKQKYEVIFEVNKKISVKSFLSFDDQVEKEEEIVLELAIEDVLLETGLDMNKKSYTIEKVVHIESNTQEDYLVAKHIFEKYDEPLNLKIYEDEGFDYFIEAVNETGIDFYKTELEKTTEILDMLYYYMYNEEIV